MATTTMLTPKFRDVATLALEAGGGDGYALAVMGKRTKNKDVFNANAVAKVDLEGEVIGRYTPTGPNKWDDYEFDRDDDGDREAVASGARLQVEPIGAQPEVLFRVRSGRCVLLLRWVLTKQDEKQVASGKWGVQEAEQASKLEKIFGLAPKNDPRDDMMEYFLDVKAEPRD